MWKAMLYGHDKVCEFSYVAFDEATSYFGDLRDEGFGKLPPYTLSTFLLFSCFELHYL